MAKNNTDSLIGRAWGAHRAGNNNEAIRDFEQVLKSDRENVDAYYGLGLAQRGAGQYAAARTSFETARDLAQQKKDVLQGGKQENNLETLEDDRYMMLLRMIGQRLEELSEKVGE
jgi:tetratricopeptide (TPR) repeat protein